VETFRELLLESFDLVIYVWPITLGVIAAALFAAFFGTSLLSAQFRSRLWLLVIPYVFPLVVLAVGAVLHYDGPGHPQWVEPRAWLAMLLAIVLFHIVAALAIATYLKGMRVRATALLLPSIWLTLSCGLVAAIAIVGVGH
jgi:hypothetical protein